MSSEKTLIATHHQSDDRAGQIAAVFLLTIFAFARCEVVTHLPTGGLSNLSCILVLACSR